MSGPFDVRGRRVLVTGASSGLGRHFALTLARAGADVVLAARRLEACEAAAAEARASGVRAAAVALDVTDAASVKAAAEAAERALGGLDVLVNNAGIAVTRPLLELTESDWDRVLDTNLKGAWLTAVETAKRMAAAGTGGSVINVASVLAFRVTKQLSSYIAAKAGLVHLTRAMALELAPHGIRVNALAPGYVETDMNRAFFATEAGAKLVRRVPQGRLGQPDDLDGALLLLASDASRYMTGAALVIDGGLACTPP